jgi:FG-GAP-like repeat/Putative Ig domain
MIQKRNVHRIRRESIATASAVRANRRRAALDRFAGLGAPRALFESLELRRLLSVFLVTNLNDSGMGSLRAAVTQADAGTTSTIDFQLGLSGTVTLSTVADTTDGPSSLLVTENVTINGADGGSGITIAGSGASRLFTVSSGGDLTLENLTLSGGVALGGAGSDGYWGGGGAAGLGGAIFNAGGLTIVNSTLTDNQAIGGAGSPYNDNPGGGGGGGLDGSASGSDPSSGVGAAGAGPNGGAGGTSNTNGQAGGFGGGGGGGAGMNLNSSSSAAGAGGFGGGGGGAGNGNGDAGAGGLGGGGGGDGRFGANASGGFGAGSGNNGGGGGGAGMGGAIFNYAGTVSITNSTFTLNTAMGGAGGGEDDDGGGLGGAVFNYNGQLTLLNATISANTADDGRGVYNLGNAGSALAVINNTILGQTDASVSDYMQSTINGGSTSSSGVGDLIVNNSGFSGTIVSTLDPMLGGLANNDGYSQTLLPADDSPVLGAGNATAAAGLTQDQRGDARFNGSLVDIGAVELILTSAPTITSADDITFTPGTDGTFTVTTTGDPTAALMETGALPTGVSFIDNGDGTATISGTPAIGSLGVYDLALAASNGIVPDASQSFTLMVDQAPAITSVDNTTFTTGSTGTFTVTTTGFPNSMLTETGALPTGVAFVDNGDDTAMLAGTPADGTGEQYVVTLNANNGFGSAASETFTLTVAQAPAITSVNNSGSVFTVGTSGTFAFTTTGFPDSTLTEMGGLPSGLTFTDNGDDTARLSGTPASGTGGVYLLTIDADNGVGSAADQTFTLTVAQAPSITSVNNSGSVFTTGLSGTFTFTTTGFPDSTLTEMGGLPSGLTFTDNGDDTATLSGTPASGTGGVYLLTIDADNGIGSAASETFTLTVAQAPAITSVNNSGSVFTTGLSGTFGLTTTGFPDSTLTEMGGLPSGLTFTDHGDDTATLSGTPASGSGGVYLLTIVADNGIGITADQTFTLTVAQAPAITSVNNGGSVFTTGTSGTFTFTTTGFPNSTLSETGILPPGLTFTDKGNDTATLSGTPAAGSGGVYDLTLHAVNGVGAAATQSFVLTVNQSPAFLNADDDAITVGQVGEFPIEVTGFPGATLSETGVLPPGIIFTDNGNDTGSLSGTPTQGASGVYMLTLQADNGAGGSVTQSFALTISVPPAITSGAAASFIVGSSASFTIQTTGFPNSTITETGMLPAGVTFANNGDGTATIFGSAAVGTDGTYDLTFQASNGTSPQAMQAFTLAVDEAPSISSADQMGFTVGTSGSFTFTATGFPAADISETGSLPAGLTFTDNDDGTATLSGKPVKGTSGTYSLMLTADNGVLPEAVQTFTLNVEAPPVLVGIGVFNGTLQLDNPNGTQRFTVTPFPNQPDAGARVALADISADGVPDIIVTTVTGNSRIKVFDGLTGAKLMGFLAFGPNYQGGMFVATGDVDGDGIPDIIVGKGTGAPRVKVFDGETGNLLASFLAFSPSFTGGVRVAAADVNNDGDADVIVGQGPGSTGSLVSVFNGQSLIDGSVDLLYTVAPFGTSFSDGVYVAAGTVFSAGTPDLVIGAGAGGPPEVAVLDGEDGSLLDTFLAFDSSFTGGVRVAVGDMNSDGLADIIAGSGPGGHTEVNILDGTDGDILQSFFAGDQSYLDGVYVAGNGT